MGLLVPASVDSISGYRYYLPGQVNGAEAVRLLRSLEMPLSEIRLLLDADDPDLTHSQLLAHRERRPRGWLPSNGCSLTSKP